MVYKVFVNEKALILSETPLNSVKNIPYEGESTISVALDMLQNSVHESIIIYHYHIAKLWNDFLAQFKSIHAAGGLVTNTKENILVIHRFGRWDLPKGKIENNESREEAALREVEEECRIQNLKILNFLQTTYHLYFDKEWILKSTFWYRMQHEGNQFPQPQTEEGIDEVKWITEEELVEMKKITYQNIKLLIELYEAERKNR